MTVSTALAVPTDITVYNEGTIHIFIGSTETGQAWLDENLETPSWAKLGNNHAVEHRYSAPIIVGAQRDGLAVREL